MRRYLSCNSLRIILRIFTFLTLSAQFACGPVDRQQFNAKFGQTIAPRTAPRINVFLNLKDEKGPALRFEISDLEVLVNDLWLPINDAPMTLDSVAIGKGQLFMGAQNVIPGECRRLRMTVNQGEMKKADSEVYDVLSSESYRLEMPIARAVDLSADDSLSLLLVWDTEGTLSPEFGLRPEINAFTPVGDLLVNLLYVTCPEIETIFVIRTDNNWVIDSFGLKGAPTYIETNANPFSTLLYVLTPADREIKVVNLSNHQIEEYFPAQLNDYPDDMAISPDGRAGYLLDQKTGFLSQIDLVTGSNKNRVKIGYRPTYLEYLDDQNLLAISLSYSQEVILVEPNTLRVVARFSTARDPFGLAVSNNHLFIAETQNETVAVFDLSTRRSLGQVLAGLGPRYLQEVNDRVYVSNVWDGSLSILSQGQLVATDSISGLGKPQSLAFAADYQRLYVADEELEGVVAIDATANQVLQVITLGAKPMDLLVKQ